MAQQQATAVTLNNPNGGVLRFNVTVTAFHGYQNAFMPDSKVAPSNNFLVQTVHPEDKAALLEFLEAGYAVEIASQVAAEFKPALDFSVKK